jgi:hypothetical protein
VGPDHLAVGLDALWTGAPGHGTIPDGAAAPADPEELNGDDPGPAGVAAADPGAAGQAANAVVPTPDESPAPTAPPSAGKAQANPQLADLLAGVLPFDGQELERGVEQFFAHLHNLGPAPTATSWARRLAPWLAGGALAAVAAEVARRRREQPIPAAPGLPAG